MIGRGNATRHATQPLCQTLLASKTPVGCERSLVLALTASHGGTTGWSTIKESTGSKASALVAVNRVYLVGGIKAAVAGAGINPGGSGEIIVSLTLSAVETVKVNVGVVGTRAPEGHVGRVLGESLHWRDTDTPAVAVGVASIEGAIVVEH